MSTPFLTALEAIEGLDVTDMMTRFQGMEVLAKRILKVFVTTDEKPLADLEAAVEAKNLEAIVFNAHTLKGMLQNIGAKKCAEMAKDLEMAGKSENLAYAVENFPSFKVAMMEFHTQIAAALG